MSASAQTAVDDAPPQIVLAADLGIEHADALKDDLMGALAANQPVVIDGASVERLHSAARLDWKSSGAAPRSACVRRPSYSASSGCWACRRAIPLLQIQLTRSRHPWPRYLL